jgi:hypothetical protein
MPAFRDQRRLTENQRLVLDYCTRAVRRGEPWPSHAEIARYMGWKYPQGAVDCMQRLERLGRVRRLGYDPASPGRILWGLAE